MSQSDLNDLLYAPATSEQADQLEMFDLPQPMHRCVCESGPRGYCRGCLRSRDERFQWHLKPAAERARIIKLLAQRQKRREAFLRNNSSRNIATINNNWTYSKTQSANVQAQFKLASPYLATS